MAKNFVPGDWEHKTRTINYLDKVHGFIERTINLDNVFYFLTEKGLKFLNGSDKVNKGQTIEVTNRKERILKYLDEAKESKDNKSISKHLRKWEPTISHDMTYQTLREMEEAGDVEHYQIKRTNYYRLPLKGVKTIREAEDVIEKTQYTKDDLIQAGLKVPELNEASDESVVIHEPKEVLNETTVKGLKVYKEGYTIGQIVDIVVYAYQCLPNEIRNDAQLFIDPKLRNIKLSIPLLGL